MPTKEFVGVGKKKKVAVPNVKLPGDPLPRCCINWPLDSKLPMVDEWKDSVVLHRRKLGKPLVHFDKIPMGFKTHGIEGYPKEYNPLHDPHLKTYINRKRKQRQLRKIGLITSNNLVKCNLKDFNTYRRYLNQVYLSYEKYGFFKGEDSTLNKKEDHGFQIPFHGDGHPADFTSAKNARCFAQFLWEQERKCAEKRRLNKIKHDKIQRRDSIRRQRKLVGMHDDSKRSVDKREKTSTIKAARDPRHVAKKPSQMKDTTVKHPKMNDSSLSYLKKRHGLCVKGKKQQDHEKLRRFKIPVIANQAYKRRRGEHGFVHFPTSNTIRKLLRRKLANKYSEIQKKVGNEESSYGASSKAPSGTQEVDKMLSDAENEDEMWNHILLSTPRKVGPTQEVTIPLILDDEKRADELQKFRTESYYSDMKPDEKDKQDINMVTQSVSAENTYFSSGSVGHGTTENIEDEQDEQIDLNKSLHDLVAQDLREEIPKESVSSLQNISLKDLVKQLVKAWHEGLNDFNHGTALMQNEKVFDESHHVKHESSENLNQLMDQVVTELQIIKENLSKCDLKEECSDDYHESLNHLIQLIVRVSETNLVNPRQSSSSESTANVVCRALGELLALVKTRVHASESTTSQEVKSCEGNLTQNVVGILPEHMSNEASIAQIDESYTKSSTDSTLSFETISKQVQLASNKHAETEQNSPGEGQEETVNVSEEKGNLPNEHKGLSEDAPDDFISRSLSDIMEQMKRELSVTVVKTESEIDETNDLKRLENDSQAKTMLYKEEENSEQIGEKEKDHEDTNKLKGRETFAEEAGNALSEARAEKYEEDYRSNSDSENEVISLQKLSSILQGDKDSLNNLMEEVIQSSISDLMLKDDSSKNVFLQANGLSEEALFGRAWKTFAQFFKGNSKQTRKNDKSGKQSKNDVTGKEKDSSKSVDANLKTANGEELTNRDNTTVSEEVELDNDGLLEARAESFKDLLRESVNDLLQQITKDISETSSDNSLQASNEQKNQVILDQRELSRDSVNDLFRQISKDCYETDSSSEHSLNRGADSIAHNSQEDGEIGLVGNPVPQRKSEQNDFEESVPAKLNEDNNERCNSAAHGMLIKMIKKIAQDPQLVKAAMNHDETAQAKAKGEDVTDDLLNKKEDPLSQIETKLEQEDANRSCPGDSFSVKPHDHDDLKEESENSKTEKEADKDRSPEANDEPPLWTTEKRDSQVGVPLPDSTLSTSIQEYLISFSSSDTTTSDIPDLRSSDLLLSSSEKEMPSQELSVKTSKQKVRKIRPSNSSASKESQKKSRGTSSVISEDKSTHGVRHKKKAKRRVPEGVTSSSPCLVDSDSLNPSAYRESSWNISKSLSECLNHSEQTVDELVEKTISEDNIVAARKTLSDLMKQILVESEVSASSSNDDATPRVRSADSIGVGRYPSTSSSTLGSLHSLPIIRDSPVLSDIVTDALHKTSSEVLREAKKAKVVSDKSDITQADADGVVSAAIFDVVEDIDQSLTDNLTSKEGKFGKVDLPRTPSSRSAVFPSTSNPMPKKGETSQTKKRRINQAFQGFVIKLTQNNLLKGCARWIKKNVFGCYSSKKTDDKRSSSSISISKHRIKPNNKNTARKQNNGGKGGTKSGKAPLKIISNSSGEIHANSESQK